jgi:hypothetical protein
MFARKEKAYSPRGPRLCESAGMTQAADHCKVVQVLSFWTLREMPMPNLYKSMLKALCVRLFSLMHLAIAFFHHLLFCSHETDDLPSGEHRHSGTQGGVQFPCLSGHANCMLWRHHFWL